MVIYHNSPVGILRIEEQDGYICSLEIVTNTLENSNQNKSELLDETVKQLDEYFAGKRKDFNLPLRQSGTDFQQRAWTQLLAIPYGSTISYKEQATTMGSPKGARAVGSANGKNNIAIIVPCHRVINCGGGLGGYAYGLEAKRKLLELESQTKTLF